MDRRNIMANFLSILLFCYLPVIRSQVCISINQPDDAYLYQPTTLNCKVESSGGVGDKYSITWYMVDKSPNGRTWLSYVADGTEGINPDYSWKITSEWDGDYDTLSLTIKNTTLMDDGAYTEWECQKTQGQCKDQVDHTFDVKSKWFVHRRKLIIESHTTVKVKK